MEWETINPSTESFVTFHVQINGGAEQTLTVKTGQYRVAAMAALALLEYKVPKPLDHAVVVKIWLPAVLPKYGPYYYAWNGYSQELVGDDSQLMLAPPSRDPIAVRYFGPAPEWLYART